MLTPRSFFAGIGAALIVVCMLGATAGGFPSRPRFQAVGVGVVAPASGSITASGTVTAGNVASSTVTATGSGALQSQWAYYANSAQPVFGMRESDAAVDAKFWALYPLAGTLVGQSINDALNASRNWLQISRSGVAIAAIDLGNATDNPAITLNGTTVRNGATARVASGVYNNNGAVCTLQSNETIGLGACTRNGNGDVTVTITSGVFDNIPTCTVTQIAAGSANRRFVQTNGLSTTTVSVVSQDSAGTLADMNFAITCIGG